MKRQSARIPSRPSAAWMSPLDWSIRAERAAPTRRRRMPRALVALLAAALANATQAQNIFIADETLLIPNQSLGAVTINSGVTVTGSSGITSYAEETNIYGTLVLSGGFTYNASGYVVSAGTININGGTLLSAEGRIGYNAGESGAATIAAGAWTNSDELQIGRSGVGLLTINGGTVTATKAHLGQGGGVGTIDLNNGVLAASEITRGSSNSTISFNGGTLRATADSASILTGFDGSSASIAAGGLTIDSNGFNIGTASVLSGAGGLTKTGLGTLTLSGANTYSGGTFVNAGTLSFASDSALGAAGGAITLNAATLQSTATQSSSRNITLSGGGTIDVASGTTFTYSGAISGTGGLSKIGDGTLALGASQNLGDVTLSGGTIDFGGLAHTSGSFTLNGGTLTNGILSSGTFSFVSGTLGVEVPAFSGLAGLRFTGNGTVGPGGKIIAAFSNAPGVGVRIASSTLGAGAASLTLDGGTIIGGTHRVGFDGRLGSLTVASGTLTAEYELFISAGVARMTGGTISSPAISFTTEAGGFLELNGGVLITDTLKRFSVNSGASFDGGKIRVGKDTDLFTGFTAGSAVLNSGGLTIDTAGYVVTAAAEFTGTGGLVKEGAGLLFLTGNNAYTGATTLNAGTLVAYADSSLGAASAPLVVNDGLFLAGASFTTARPVTLGAAADGISVVGGHTLTLSGPVSGAGSLEKIDAGSLTISGNVSVDGGVVVKGGTLSLTGNNSFDGGVAIRGGTLIAASDQSLGASGNGITLDGGTFGASASFSSNRPVTIGSGGGALSAANGVTLTLDGEVSGSVLLTKTGDGTVALAGDYAHTGPLNVAGGTLSWAKSSPVALADLTIQSAATFETNGVDATIISLSGGGTLSLGAGVLTNGDPASSRTFTSAITGGGLLKTGAGTLTLSGTNEYTGAVTISAGTLKIGAGGSTGSLSASSVNNQGTLTFDHSSDSTFSTNISGGGALKKLGAGTLTLSGTHTHTGGTSVEGGAILVPSGGSISDPDSTLFVGGSTGTALNISGGSITSGPGAIGHLAGQTGTVDLSAGTWTSPTIEIGRAGVGVFSMSGGVASTGLINLGAGGGVGTLSLNGGVLIGENVKSWNSSSSMTAAGGTFRFTAASTDWLAGFTSKPISLGVGGLTLDTNGFNGGTGSVFSGSGGLTKSGAGTLTLRGGNTYTGDTTIEAGSVVLGANHAVPDAGTLHVAAGASFSFAGFTDAIGALSGAGAVHVDTPMILAVGFNDRSSTFSGTISGTGSLTKTGAGTFTLSGANTHTGGSRFEGGNTIIASGGSISHPGVSLFVGRTGGSSSLEIAGGSITSGAGAIGYFSGQTGVVNMSAGSWQSSLLDIGYVGSGKLHLTGGSASTSKVRLGFVGGRGELVLDGGVLATSSVERWSSLSSFAASGGTVRVTEASADFMPGFSAGSATLNAGGLTIDSNGFDIVTTAAFSGAGGLTKTGSGTLTLSSAQTYTGSTVVNAGTLALGADDVLPATTTLAVNHGATLDTGNRSLALAALSGTGAGILALGSGSLTVGSAGTDTTWAGAITGSGNLTKTGTGSLTLSGANTYTGPTAINAGTLAVGLDGSLGSPSATVAVGTASTGALDIPGGSVVADKVTLGLSSGVGTLTLSSDGTLTTSTVERWSGGSTVTFDGGTLRAAGDAPQLLNGFTISSAVLGAGGLTVDTNSYAVGFSANTVLSGVGGLTKAGSGTLTLSTTQAYSGPTIVNAGTLLLGAGDVLPAASAVAINTGGTLDTGNRSLALAALSGTGAGSLALGSGTLTVGSAGPDTTFSGAISGTGGLTKVGTGALTLSGTNTYSGDTTVNAGSLVVGGGTLGHSASHLVIANTGSADVTLTGGSVTAASVVLGHDGGTASLALNGGTLTTSTVERWSVSSAISFDGGTLRASADAPALLSGFAEGSAVLNSGGLTLDTNGFAVGTASVLSGTGGLTKIGAGTLTFASAQGYSGATTIDAGTLSLSPGGSIPDGSTVTVSGGATLSLADNSDTIGALAGGGTISLGSATLTIGANGFSTTFTGGFTGTGGLTKIGGGTFTLQSEGIRGTVAVSAGTLALAANLSTAPFTVASGATLAGTGSLGSLAGSGILAPSSTLVVGALGTSTSFDGTYAGAGGLDKVGSGSLTLSGSGSLGGLVDARFGTLAFANADLTIGSAFRLGFGGTGSSTVTNSTLTLPTVERWNVASTLTLDGATLRASGDHAAFINGFNDGSTSIAAGGLTLDTNGHSIGFSANTSLGGSGALTKTGYGTLTLSAAHTYSGGTTIAAGTLRVANSSGSALGSGPVTVTAGATLAGSGSFSGPLLLEGTLAPGNSPGTLSTGSQTWAGGGAYEWEINDANGAAGTAYDTVSITGSLTFTATPLNPFTVYLRSLDGDNQPGLLANFDPAQNYTFRIASFSAGVVGFDPASVRVSTAGFSNPISGLWSVALNGSQLDLTYIASPIPEPATFAGLAGLAALGLSATRRRRRPAPTP